MILKGGGETHIWPITQSWGSNQYCAKTGGGAPRIGQIEEKLCVFNKYRSLNKYKKNQQCIIWKFYVWGAARFGQMPEMAS